MIDLGGDMTKRFSSICGGISLWLHSALSPLVLGIGLVVVFGLFQTDSSARQPASGVLVAAEPATPAVASGSAWQQPGGETGTQVIVSEMHNAFLPLVSRGYGPRPPDSVLGIQLFADHREDELVIQLDQMGVRWARTPIFWRQIERERDNYRWPAWLDDWLARLSARDIEVILTLAGNPDWAATYLSGPIDKVDISELTDFMAAAVARYSAPPYNVKHWELYNEPDNGSEVYAEAGWGYWGNDPDLYAEMLAAVYPKIKMADPDAQVLFGGLAYDYFEPDGPFVRDFLDKVLQHGGGPYFDIMNFHYYPSFDSTWNPYGPAIIGKAEYLRGKLAEYGVDKPFICTEISMWSDAAHGGSYEKQSRYVPLAFVRSIAADLGVTIWYKLVDDAAVGVTKYGLLEADLTPKPAVDAVETLAWQLADADYIQSLGPAETGSEEIEAYEFLTEDGLTQILVVWSNDEQWYTMSLESDYLLRVDKYGSEQLIRDQDDGVVDGWVQVSVNPDPAYLRLPVGAAMDQ
jgi:hypothetical protein